MARATQREFIEHVGDHLASFAKLQAGPAWIARFAPWHLDQAARLMVKAHIAARREREARKVESMLSGVPDGLVAGDWIRGEFVCRRGRVHVKLDNPTT